MGRTRTKKAKPKPTAVAARGKARARKLPIVYPKEQHFACRDCPARCCTSWGIPVNDEERARILSDDEAVVRLNERAKAILRAGVLPMREKDGRLACVFLDDDMLCSLHKRHGHAFLPATCQAFPFGFSMNETGEAVALLSRYCPSIRDDYGEPIGDVIDDKLEQTHGAHPMADKLGLRSGRTLTKHRAGLVLARWAEELEDADDPASVLAHLYDWTEEVDHALPKIRDLSREQVETAMEKASSSTKREPLAPHKRTFDVKVLFSYLLGGLCLPSRLMHPHRTAKPTFWERIRSWGNQLAWIFGVGKVRLLYIDEPVRLGRIDRVAPFLRGANAREVSRYLGEVIQRRQGMAKLTYLHRVLVDLAFMTVVISRYARAAASSVGSAEVSPKHVREAIGIAELLLTHQGDADNPVLAQLRAKLMAGRTEYRRLLAAEL